MSRSKKGWGFWKRLTINILVITIIGILINAFLNWAEKNLSDEIKLKRLKEDKTRYNEGVDKATMNEKWIYFTARTIIAMSLLVLNVWYYYMVAGQELSKVLNIDEVIILSYSFIAFSIAGTPSKFVELLRTTIINLRRRWHVGNLDITAIESQIVELELKIANKTKNIK